MDMAENKLLTVQEVANRLSVHPDTVRQWIRNGEIGAIDLGGRAGYRISEEDLERFIRERFRGPSDR
jgi:excisionase family DNA binding protein